jgi:hypothetical protein
VKVIDDDARSEFNGPGVCTFCRKWAEVRDCHHAFIKCGMGGGSQLDVPENLAALHRAPCHFLAENDTHVNERTRERIAERHGLTTGAIWEALWAILRLPKGSDQAAEAILDALRVRPVHDAQDGEQGPPVRTRTAGPSPDVRAGGVADEKEGWIDF